VNDSPRPPRRRPWIAVAASTCLILMTFGCAERDPQAAPVKPATSNEPHPQVLPTIQMKLGTSTVTLMVADEDHERQMGLMHRRDMKPDEGMIFAFPAEAPRAFWMRNTPIDLDIVYLDRTGKVVSIRRMNAYSEATVPSGADAKYAIELNAGRAAELGLVVGQALDVPADVRDAAR
jgi:uncharacterized protein